MNTVHKQCPRCGVLATLDAGFCSHCGHQFRTAFISSDNFIPQRNSPVWRVGRFWLWAAVGVLFVLINWFLWAPSFTSPIVGTWTVSHKGSEYLILQFSAGGDLNVSLLLEGRDGENKPHPMSSSHWKDLNGVLELETPIQGVKRFQWSSSDNGRILTLVPQNDAVQSGFSLPGGSMTLIRSESASPWTHDAEAVVGVWHHKRFPGALIEFSTDGTGRFGRDTFQWSKDGTMVLGSNWTAFAGDRCVWFVRKRQEGLLLVVEFLGQPRKDFFPAGQYVPIE